MFWQTITLTVPEELKEAVVGEFSSDRIAGVWERVADEGGGTEMVLYFDTGKNVPLVNARVGRLFERNGYPVPRVEVGLQEKEDWNREWRKGFTSFPLSRRFRVVPSWEEPPAHDDRMPLGIDPGLAFGTGTHETTQMVVGELEDLPPGEGLVLDLGTGSAILSIASARLGHDNVVGCDIDADAVQVARENIRRNRCDVPVFVGSADAVATHSVRLILANLTADVLEDVLADVQRILVGSGTAVLSGILDVQAATVRDRFLSSGFEVSKEQARGEWVAMVVVKSP
jgi:ribosomal protein L11 methyltransferase